VVRLGEGLERGEDVGGARWVFGERLAAARVDADCAVEIASWLSSIS
jgi:hypothetical protein